MKNLNQYLSEQLKDPVFKEAWEESKVQYELVRKLIKERLDKKLSQNELAKNIGTTQAVISRIENFSVNPSLLLMERVARGLGKKLEIRLV